MNVNAPLINKFINTMPGGRFAANQWHNDPVSPIVLVVSTWDRGSSDMSDRLLDAIEEMLGADVFVEFPRGPRGWITDGEMADSSEFTAYRVSLPQTVIDLLEWYAEEATWWVHES